MINYVDEDVAFERWCENNYLPIESQAIWKKLFKRFNRSGWSEWITVDNLTLMADVQIRHEKTFIGYRDKLIEVGLIKYIKGKKGSPNRYKFVSYEIYTSKNEVHSTVNSTVEPTVYSTVEPTAEATDITKPNKTKQNKRERADAPPSSSAKKFVPPDVSEVMTYCQNRGNGIDAESFVNFYASKNWMIGKNKMADWKRAVITWEKRDKAEHPEKYAAPPEPVQQGRNVW